VELTGKVIIISPECQPGQTYEADSNECIQNDAAPDNPVPTPPIDTPRTPASIGPPGLLILTAIRVNDIFQLVLERNHM
jgi:hypothetical protein